MRGARRSLGIAMLLLALFAVAAGEVSAKPAGTGPGNKPNAKLCQKGGWQYVYTSAGESFSSEEECTSYAASGGAFTTSPSPQAQCAALGGSFQEGGDDGGRIFGITAPVYWACYGYADPTVFVEGSGFCTEGVYFLQIQREPGGVYDAYCYSAVPVA